MSIRRTVLLPISTDDAFALVTDPWRLRRWQAVSARIELVAAGAYRWTITPGHIAAGTVREVEPGRRLVLGWGWLNDAALPPNASTLTITLEPVEGGTQVTINHEGLDPQAQERHLEGWSHYLERLVAAATNGDAGPDEWAAGPEQFDLFTASETSLAALQGVLRLATTQDQDNPTPCGDFTAHQLAEHLMDSLVRLGAMAGAELTLSGRDLEDKVATLGAGAIEAWRARGLEGTVDAGGRELPAAMAATILSIELLVHGWDFAQSFGVDLAVEDRLVDYVREQATAVIEGGRGRAFHEEVAAEPDADALTRFMAFTGRAPLAR